MVLDDFFAYGEPNARAPILTFAMQSLENNKDFFRIFRGDANAIVTYTEFKKSIVFSVHANLYVRAIIFPGIFEGITDQILKQLRKLLTITFYRG